LAGLAPVPRAAESKQQSSVANENQKEMGSLVNKNILGMSVMLIVWALPASAIDVTVTTSGSTLSPDADATLMAGTYYNSSFASNASHATLSVNNVAANKTWTVYARLDTAVAGLTLEAKVTNSQGTSGCTVTPLSSDYQNITTDYTTTGKGVELLKCASPSTGVSGIPLQFQINGLDPTDGHGTTNFSVIYTVIEN